jgi:hypothetical protein
VPSMGLGFKMVRNAAVKTRRLPLHRKRILLKVSAT